MASELKPHTPTPWIASVDYVCYMPPSDPGALATPIADFQHPYDAAYAVKAVNMHERLVAYLRQWEWDGRVMSRDNQTIEYYCEECEGWKPDHKPDCEKAALLKEATDA